MAASNKTFDDVKKTLLSVNNLTKARDIIEFYNTWAESYDQDFESLDYHGPRHVANCLSSGFLGDQETARVLDLACGTGAVAELLKSMGFKQFVGVDGSKNMLDLAAKIGLYQDLKECMLGYEPLPVQAGWFDVVVIAGAMTPGYVPVSVVREMCEVTKPGGYVCMGMRASCDNLEYIVELEQELNLMEEATPWDRVEVKEKVSWLKDDKEGGRYIPGVVYLYRKALQ
ncbi:Williams-Beuren syndrome chromosomal region 27 protein [Esox lucius]|uniref:Williams-Beuren syndrome chromosomal region 27 protein n=1 Tax=Esox lucius TaxID=8010 RepID=C1BWC0_ESOLU|nr:Williams-Beuren syndrome chromosomal region 27 protein [Esox lucius]ACO13323.1 Williams-Beuren syndrome chromosomal region 27 protein [Esox lucius]